MSLASNRNLLLLVVGLAGLGVLGTFGVWIRERSNAGRIAVLERELDDRRGLPDRVSRSDRRAAALTTSLESARGDLRRLAERLDVLEGVPASLRSQAVRADGHDATLTRVAHEITGLRSRCDDILRGYESLAEDARKVARALRALELRTEILEKRASPTEKPAGATGDGRRGG